MKKQKCKEFKLGDVVKISDIEFRYTTYPEWFDEYAPILKEDYLLTQELVLKTFHTPEKLYVVSAVGAHTDCKSHMLYAVKDLEGHILLMLSDGLDIYKAEWRRR